MARFTISSKMDDYTEKLNDLRLNTKEYFDAAIKKGGGVVADAVRAEINALPINTGYKKRGNEMIRGLNTLQKGGLQDSLGIAPPRDDGDFRNVKVGFDGYNQNYTDAYPNGQPNVVIARSVEKGTSFRSPNPFIARAARKSKEKATKTMEDEIDRIIGDMFK